MPGPPVHELPLNNLLPIQAGGVSYWTLSDGENLRTPTPHLKPIKTLLYEGDLGELEATYLVLDGHNRAYGAHLLGRATVLGQIYTEDEHVRKSSALSTSGITSIEELKERYRNEWLPLLAAAGIVSIATMPIRHEPQPGYLAEQSLRV